MKLTSFRLPENLISDIDGLAARIHKTKSFIIVEALQEYLEEYQDYLIAMERFNDKNDPIVSAKEMRKLLKKP